MSQEYKILNISATTSGGITDYETTYVSSSATSINFNTVSATTFYGSAAGLTDTSTFTGGTVSGDTNFSSNLSASTFYLNGSQVTNALPFNIYVDDTQQNSQGEVRWYHLFTSGGTGIASKYLTSDGLTKTGGNTFLFSSVFGGSGNATTIQAVDEAPACHGFNYNTSTGLAQWLFLESKTTGVLIGGTVDGLEVEENSTAVNCWVQGLSINSGTTFFPMTTDVYTTGGTYSSSSGAITFGTTMGGSYVVSGLYKGFSTIVIVKTTADLPTPSGGFYDLTTAGTLYYIDTTLLNIGTNYLKCSENVGFRGNSSLLTTILYTGTGAAIRGTDVSCSFSLFSVSAPQAFDFTNTARDKYISFQNLGIASQTSASTITGYKVAVFEIVNCLSNVGVFNFTNNGYLVTNFIYIDSSNTGTQITINPNTYTKLSLNNIDLTVNSGSTGINITSTNISLGQINGCIFQGTATAANRLVGVNGNTTGWDIHYGDNTGISGLQYNDIEIISTTDATFANGAGTYIESSTVRAYIPTISYYDSLATSMEAKIISLMTSAEATFQIGVRNISSLTNLGGLQTAVVPGKLGVVESGYVAITPNRLYNAYYVKTSNTGGNVATRYAIKIRVKTY